MLWIFGGYEMAKVLLAKGADPNHCAGTGESVLYLAITGREDNSNVVRLLVQNGARLANAGERDFVAGMTSNVENRQTYYEYLRTNH
jgi:ankyrin repeat protein